MNHALNFRHGPVIIQEGYGSEPYHLHQNAQEIIWVLEGQAGITFNNVEYILDADDDLILIVDSDAHMIRKMSSHLRYLSFYIDLPFFQNTIKDILHVGLYCNPGYRPPQQQPYLQELRKMLAQIVWEYQIEEGSQAVIDITERLLLLLRNHFNFLGTTSLDYRDRDTFDRLFKVYDFIYQHYKERITLSDLAAQIHVSRSYLSRSIKQITGMGFTDILNYVRCEEAVRLLLGTEKSITSIAFDCGFSDPKYFNQYFTRFFHANPMEFRNFHKGNTADGCQLIHQKKLSYDDALRDFMERFWKDSSLRESKPFTIPFSPMIESDSPLQPPSRDLQPLQIRISPRDVEHSSALAELLHQVSDDFPCIQLNIQTDVTVPAGYQEILSNWAVPLFAPHGTSYGLYSCSRMKTPLYHLLSRAAQASGVEERGPFWILFRNSAEGRMILLAWNHTDSSPLEFHVTFEASDDRYLVLREELSGSLSETLSQLDSLTQQKLLSSCSRSQKAIWDLPTTSMELLPLSDYGYTCKIRPGGCLALTIIRS